MAAHGWSDLDDDDLASLDDGEAFEQFCADLIEYEAFDRHDAPELDGPAGRHVADGGRDILLTIQRPPRTTKGEYQRTHHLHPLTEDGLERTAYSCKSGPNWLDLALRDVKSRKQPGRSVEVLLAGGHFKLLINTIGTLDGEVTRGDVERTPHAHIAAAYWERLKTIKLDAEDPSARIEILDARKLAGFLRARRPESGSIVRWADRLDVRPPLYTLEEWRALHREERDEPAFSADAERDKLHRDFVAFMTGGHERTAWLVGPPGVGKTRILLETLLAEKSVGQRVLVALDPEEALRALGEGRLLARQPSIVLVVDDCPAVQVDSLAARFRAAQGPSSSARLLVITPGSEQVMAEARTSPRWFLHALDAPATRKLATDVLGDVASSDEAGEIVRLSEGYPWFATLLAREALAEGRPPRDLREATQWALGSLREARPGPDLDALRLRRARCLLAASLTRRADWNKLSEAGGEHIARAVQLPGWHEVLDIGRDCLKRGILRRNVGWQYKYVTPLVLEREVIAWLLDPDGGHDPGGRALAKYAHDYLNDFFETLSLLGLPRTLLQGIAGVGLEDLDRAPLDPGALRGAGLLGARLLFIARHEPTRTARVLRARVEAVGVEANRARVDERRSLVFALEELAARRDAFEDAEAALFVLALAENESYANNATGTWAGLFLVDLATTYRPLSQRLALLTRRLDDSDPAARRHALAGVGALLTTTAFRRVIEPLDGARPTPTAEEARTARTRAWQLLTNRFADRAPEVAREAVRIASQELRGSIRMGLTRDAVTAIAAHVTELIDAERVRLREKLEEVHTYDAEWLADDSEPLERLSAALAPTSYRERLRQQVGAWGPAGLRKDDDARDDALAREGLLGDAPIRAELDWLSSDEAQRAHVFAYALGRCDERGLLLDELRRRARAWRTERRARIIFARYLGGVGEAGRVEAADAALRALHTEPEDATSLALTIIELGATDERVAWLEAALAAQELDPACILELGRRRHWLKDVSAPAFERFVAALAHGATVEESAAALELMVSMLEEHPDRTTTLRPLLLHVLERLSTERVHGMTDYYWNLGAGMLVEHGEVDRVAVLATAALARSSGASDDAWAALHRAALRDPAAAWRAVSAALARRDAGTGRLLIAFRFHRRSFAWPCADVLAWVGHDEQRGRMVVSLVRPYGDELDPILRALLQRFGAYGSVANEIMARIESTDGAVSSLADYDSRQLDRARRWLADPDPTIRSFAERLEASLVRSHEEHAAYEDDERRRWGT